MDSQTALPADASTSPPSLAAIALKTEIGIAYVLRFPIALLVAAEIAVLFSGVVARYVFVRPLVWSDELASTLFLWLAMLGAVAAFQRGEHMRMTALVTRLKPGARAFIEVFAVAASLAFLLLIMPAALEYANEQAIVFTPALDLQDSWRAAAMPCGMGLMAVFAVLRLLRFGNLRLVAVALGLVAVLVAVFWFIGPSFRTLGNLNLVIFFIGVVAAGVLSGVPIAFSFGLATFGYLSLTTRTPPLVIVGRIDEGVSQLILLAVPMFVCLGQLMEMTGVARAIVGFLASLLGGVRGGLHYVLVAGMYLVSGISGSKAADQAAIAPALFPEMVKRGAKEGDLLALLSATGAQTETIPPSIVLITIGSVTGVSIAALFTGGMLPGVILGLTLCGLVWWRNRHEDVSTAVKPPPREILRLFVISLPAMVLPFLIRAAVIEGVATATEVSTIGIAYCIVAGLLVYRQFDWKRVLPILVETASLSGAILLIIGMATSMAWSLTQSGFSHALAKSMTGLPGGSLTFLAITIVAFVILGSVLEGIPSIVLFGPLLFPIARTVGIHPVHYAMVVILAMGIGLFSPPFGVGYYGACAVSRIKPDLGIRPIVGYMIALLVGLIIVALIPWISIGFL